MKIHIKRASLLALCLLLLFVNKTVAFANESKEKSGKLRIQIERIDEEEKGSGSVETELDKLFPELFDPKIEKKIKAEQQQNKNNLQTFKHTLFQENDKLEQENEALSESLFTADYQEPRTDNDTESESSPFSLLLLLTFICFAALLLTGLFWMIRKFA